MHQRKKQLKLLWEYLAGVSSSQKPDALFIFGRDDFTIVQTAAALYKLHKPKLVLLGGRGRLTGAIEGTESEAFKAKLLALDVPENDMLLEGRSTNTGENVVEGLKLHAEHALGNNVGLVTHAPHMRRTLAVAKAQNESIGWLPFPDECKLDLAPEKVVASAKELVGEVDRLEKYPALGYFAEQNIPAEVTAAKKEVEHWLAEKN